MSRHSTSQPVLVEAIMMRIAAMSSLSPVASALSTNAARLNIRSEVALAAWAQNLLAPSVSVMTAPTSCRSRSQRGGSSRGSASSGSGSRHGPCPTFTACRQWWAPRQCNCGHCVTYQHESLTVKLRVVALVVCTALWGRIAWLRFGFRFRISISVPRLRLITIAIPCLCVVAVLTV